jgi:hypothetical protein
MKVAFFHGLESPARSEKNEILEEIFGTENVYAPAMDYRNPQMFTDVLNHLRENPVDLLIGSSMGGYFGYNLSTHVNVKTLLFNPAVHSRSFEPQDVTQGKRVPAQTLVLGVNDKLINPLQTVKYFDKHNSAINVYLEEMEHRIPANIFRKHLINIK